MKVISEILIVIIILLILIGVSYTVTITPTQNESKSVILDNKDVQIPVIIKTINDCKHILGGRFFQDELICLVEFNDNISKINFGYIDIIQLVKHNNKIKDGTVYLLCTIINDSEQNMVCDTKHIMEYRDSQYKLYNLK